MLVEYVGRFAPSPSGPLHAGSVVAALASYLDARASGGRWLVRMEDLDTLRNVEGADQVILRQMRALGFRWDGEVCYQSDRLAAYESAFLQLQTDGLIYPCGCTRKEIADSVLAIHGKFPHGERPYPGNCRDGLPAGRVAKSWRLRVDPVVVAFEDRWFGPQSQAVDQLVGDFVLRRADGLWAYQLAVVVDDAWQGVTHVVRGSDLLSSTARQMLLGRMLGLQALQYMHVPVLMDEQGRKLSKQNGAQAVQTDKPLVVLEQAWIALGFEKFGADDLQTFFSGAIERWAGRFRETRLAPS